MRLLQDLVICNDRKDIGFSDYLRPAKAGRYRTFFHGNKFPTPERQGNSGQLEADYQGISRGARDIRGSGYQDIGNTRL